ncbi:MAG: hypothetical protein JWQ94_1814 [Tardiphaga sp.]|nr:hypothetical protein [Tardiphaga sp.]
MLSISVSRPSGPLYAKVRHAIPEIEWAMLSGTSMPSWH